MRTVQAAIHIVNQTGCVPKACLAAQTMSFNSRFLDSGSLPEFQLQTQAGLRLLILQTYLIQDV